MRLAATLWAGTEPLIGQADEGSRHLRPAGVRLMHDRPSYQRAPRAARDLFRPHGGRGLVAADLATRPSAASAPPSAPAATRCARTLLTGCPHDLRGRALLDAGCGTGALAVEAARRGAERRRDRPLADAGRPCAASACPAISAAGSIEFRVGDMLDPALGRFDHVVAMDSLIHYARRRYRSGVAGGFGRARRCARSLFTFAPRTPPLAVMHAVGRAVPAQRPRAGDRAGGREALRAGCAGGTRARRLADAAAAQRDRQRLLHVPGAGAACAHERHRTPRMVRGWIRLGPRFLPFADAATAELPLGRLLRLSLFQVSVGMAVVLLNGTLNRVMIVELGVPTWLVAVMVSLPLVFAPLRALIGFRSDTTARCWAGGGCPISGSARCCSSAGFAIMPFALIVLSGDSNGPAIDRPGRRGAGLPAGRRRAAHDPDRGPGACHRSRARRNRGRASWRCSTSCCWSAWWRARSSSARCWRTSAQMRLIQVIQGAALVDACS